MRRGLPLRYDLSQSRLYRFGRGRWTALLGRRHRPGAWGPGLGRIRDPAPGRRRRDAGLLLESAAPDARTTGELEDLSRAILATSALQAAPGEGANGRARRDPVATSKRLAALRAEPDMEPGPVETPDYLRGMEPARCAF